MPQKKQVRLSELKLGIFIVAVIILFLALIVGQSWGIKWFSDTIPVVTYLTGVGGLKSGAPVWLAGIEIGRVRSVSIIKPENYEGNASIYQSIDEVMEKMEAFRELPELSAAEEKNLRNLQNDVRELKQNLRMVEILLDVGAEYLDRIGIDSEVSIESKGLIGDSFINISPGATGIRPQLKGEYYIIESVQSSGFREIMTGANDVVANFGVLSSHFKDLTQRLTSDSISGGVINIINDAQKTVGQANRTFSQAASLLTTMREGEGTIGKLVSDPSLYNRLVESLEKFNSLAESIQNGEGTIGRFINDPSLYESADATLKKADAIMARIESGEGTLGKLITDDAFYERTTVALDGFATLMAAINRGEGTLGKLLKDPSLYNNLDQSTSEITKLLYDIRKDPKRFLTIKFKLF